MARKGLKDIDFISLRLYNRGMNKELNIPTLNCLRCGHEWIPNRPVEPKVCPKCNSPYWNKPKVKQSGPKNKGGK